MRSLSARFGRAAAGKPRRSRTGCVLTSPCRAQHTAASAQAELLHSMLLPVVETQLKTGMLMRAALANILHTDAYRRPRLALLALGSCSARNGLNLGTIKTAAFMSGTTACFCSTTGASLSPVLFTTVSCFVLIRFKAVSCYLFRPPPALFSASSLFFFNVYMPSTKLFEVRLFILTYLCS